MCGERGAVLVVGAGTHDTRRSVAALAALGGRPEITAALVPVPYYVRPGPAGVVEHYRRLARAAPVPLVAYHVPYRSGQPLDAAAVRALAGVPGVVGIKYASGVIDQDTVDLMTDRPAGFAVLAGDDVLLAPMLALGAAGGILAAAHLATSAFVRLAGDRRPGAGDRLPAVLARLAAAVFAEPNPTVVKAVLHAQGRIPTAAVRLPLLPAGPDSTRAALDRLAEADLVPVPPR